MKIMKEQPHYNITPEKGWAKMKPLLDEVMPEGKSSRRLPFFWWAASAVIVAGVLGVYFMIVHVSNGLNGTPEALTTESMQGAEAAESIFTLEESSLHDEGVGKSTEVNKITASSSEGKKVDQISINQDLQKQTKRAQDKVLPVKKENIKGEQFSEPMAALDHQQSEDIEMGALNTIENIDANGSLGAMTSVDLDNKFNESLISLPRNPVAIEPVFVLPIPVIAEESSNRTIAFSNTNKKGKRIPALLNPTLVASSLVGMNGGLGVYGGAGVDLNITRGFSLTTALGYSSYKPNANFLGARQDKLSFSEFNPILNFDPLSGLDSYVYAESINVEADYAEINPLVQTISQWQVDIGLNWRFSRRFYASGGVKFGFATEAFSQFPIVRGDVTGIPTYPQEELSNSLSSYDVIRKSNTSMFFGLGYRLGKHFDVFANWTHGFDQYVLNSEKSYAADLSTGQRTDYIRGLGVGLKYSIL